MVVIGIDPHKSTHTASVLDEATGRLLEHVTLPARDEGHRQLVRWAEQHPERRWAIEDCRQVSGRLERALLAQGETVVRVPAKLMGQSRRASRSYGKSDPIDATAVARAALREPDLDHARNAGECDEIALLINRHDALVAERTRESNRLRWHLHDYAPDMAPPPRKLAYSSHVRQLQDFIEDSPVSTITAIMAELLERIDQLNHRIATYHRQLVALVSAYAPRLLEIPGCGALNAARIVAEIGPGERFSSDAQLAMHAGTAPLPASSGRTDRFRLNRRGNRRLNCALHRIAVSQLRHHEPAREFVSRHRDNGKTSREALRALKRHLTRRVFQAVCRPALT
jgi:transposase